MPFEPPGFEDLTFEPPTFEAWGVNPGVPGVERHPDPDLTVLEEDGLVLATIDYEN